MNSHPAFATPFIPATATTTLRTTSLLPPTLSTRPSPARRAQHAHHHHQPRMLAERIRPAVKKHDLTFDDDDMHANPQPATAPEVAAISASVCDFMNREHVRDVANYIVRFGQQFDDLSQLSAVKMTGLDASGFTADIVSCDDSHCVCVQERLDWPLGLCTNAHDVINALKHLSMACGLPADF